MTQLATSTPAEIVRENFNFRVDKFPLSGPDNMPTPFYGLFRDDTGDVVCPSSVSANYVPHQSDDVIALAEAAQEAFGTDVNVQCHFNHGHFVSLGPTDDQRRELVGTKDAVFPRMIIRAGYDGRAFRADLGMYRDLCRNLVMLRTVEKASTTIRHSSQLSERMDELITRFRNLQGSWNNLLGAIRTMQNHKMRVQEFIESVYTPPESDAGKRAKTMYGKRINAILTRLYDEHQATNTPVPTSKDSEVSTWALYNAVQGYVQHEQNRRGYQTSFARALLAANEQAVIKAEKLALSV